MPREDWPDAPEPERAGPSNQALLVALVGLAAVLVVVVSAYLLVIVPRQDAAEREARARLAERAPVVRRPEPSPEPVAVLPEPSGLPESPSGFEDWAGDTIGEDPDTPVASPPAAARPDPPPPPRPTPRPETRPAPQPDPRPLPARPGSAEATADTYLARMAGRSLPTMLGMYASRVRYYDRGIVAQDAIERDKADYARRWPERRYTRTSTVTSRPGSDGTRTLRFDYDFVVRGGDRERAGRAWTELDIEPFEGDFLIRGERGGTY